MFSAIISFLFPKACLSCRELHEGKGIFCARCLIGLELIRKTPPYSFKKPRAWYRVGALFDPGGPADALLYDTDRFAKEIAAFFTIQYVHMRWPLPDAFYIEPAFKPIGRYMTQFLPIKKASKKRDYAGKKILMLTENLREYTIPEFLLGARIFLLSYHSTE